MEIRSLSFSALTPEERDALSPLLTLFPYDLKETTHTKILLLAAYELSVPVGILIAQFYPSLLSSIVRHLYVLPTYQNQGVATTLIDEAMRALRAIGIRSIEAQFEGSSPSAAALFQLQKHFGWSEPTPRLTRYFFDPLLFTPNWLTHPPPLPPGQTLFPWSEHTPEDRTQVERFERASGLVQYLSPFAGELPFSPSSSVGLRDETGIIGWMITHHPSPQILRYSAFYIHPEHRGTGSAAALLAKAIRLHAAKEPGSVGLAEIQPQNTRSFWKKFVEKRLSPFSIEINQLYSSHKIDF